MLEKENNYTLKTYMSPKKDYFNRNYIHFQPLIFRGNIRYFSEKHLPKKKNVPGPWILKMKPSPIFFWGEGLPSLKLTAKAPANGPGPKKEMSSSNHQFSGTKPLVSPSASWPGQPSKNRVTKSSASERLRTLFESMDGLLGTSIFVFAEHRRIILYYIYILYIWCNLYIYITCL